mmetsp:Transcript_21781/g.52055  ORF Transcript_21781/g.52055 Transcript_21781/m.52055 type:complete len:225 (+) Transcript_21781:1235-1909(+)
MGTLQLGMCRHSRSLCIDLMCSRESENPRPASAIMHTRRHASSKEQRENSAAKALPAHDSWGDRLLLHGQLYWESGRAVAERGAACCWQPGWILFPSRPSRASGECSRLRVTNLEKRARRQHRTQQPLPLLLPKVKAPLPAPRLPCGPALGSGCRGRCVLGGPMEAGRGDRAFPSGRRGTRRHRFGSPRSPRPWSCAGRAGRGRLSRWPAATAREARPLRDRPQ